MKALIILRGVPGCGKTTVASIIGSSPGDVICSADDYFIDANGAYNFDGNKIGLAHKSCQYKAKEAMKNNSPKVIISNTNISESNFKEYEKMAEKFGYQVFHMIVENRHGNSNIHGVPEEKLKQMENNLRNSIKLI